MGNLVLIMHFSGSRRDEQHWPGKLKDSQKFIPVKSKCRSQNNLRSEKSDLIQFNPGNVLTRFISIYMHLPEESKLGYNAFFDYKSEFFFFSFSCPLFI